ncbi:MAG: GPR endopeptidase [Clostridium sp.]|jgi:spore protease|nr:GPR endopeptidase [Clostridium sp.]
MALPRTDLAHELHERSAPQAGIIKTEEKHGDCVITRLRVGKNADSFGKPAGNYVTLRFDQALSSQAPKMEQALLLAREISAILKKIPLGGRCLVLGLGNAQVTPDSLGPRTAGLILTTRGRGIEGLREVCALAPGVFAQTGIDSAELLRALVGAIKPALVVAVDALAAGDISRLGNTVQLTDTGISPGSGVQNTRPELSRSSLGVAVLAVGVPTVVDYPTEDGTSHFVAPRDIDLLSSRAARLIALGINAALQPGLSPEDISELMTE